MIFPLKKRLADLNWNSTFEKKNLMISLEGAIFISIDSSWVGSRRKNISLLKRLTVGWA